MKREEEQQKNGSWGWLYGVTAGVCVAAMQIGVGMLQMERDYALILGASAMIYYMRHCLMMKQSLALPGLSSSMAHGFCMIR